MNGMPYLTRMTLQSITHILVIVPTEVSGKKG